MQVFLRFSDTPFSLRQLRHVTRYYLSVCVAIVPTPVNDIGAEWHFQPNSLSDHYLYKVFFTLPLWFRCFDLRDGIDGSPLLPWLRSASRRAPSPSPRRRRSTVCQLATQARSFLRRFSALRTSLQQGRTCLVTRLPQQRMFLLPSLHPSRPPTTRTLAHLMPSNRRQHDPHQC
jgi:hypothetical protein